MEGDQGVMVMTIAVVALVLSVAGFIIAINERSKWR